MGSQAVQQPFSLACNSTHTHTHNSSSSNSNSIALSGFRVCGNPCRAGFAFCSCIRTFRCIRTSSIFQQGAVQQPFSLACNSTHTHTHNSSSSNSNSIALSGFRVCGNPCRAGFALCSCIRTFRCIRTFSIFSAGGQRRLAELCPTKLSARSQDIQLGQLDVPAEILKVIRL